MQDKPDQTEPTDMALLRQYVREGSQDAFTALVRRRIDMVYCAALRQVKNPATAQDVSQGVFITLARKAGGLVDRDVVLSAWLLRATHLMALDTLRRERRRRRHEQQAATMNANQPFAERDDSRWDEISPLLDRAMMGLRESDRRAIALRFFEGRGAREIGALQGISEEAARQRVWRAVERLRQRLGTQGVTASVSGLAGVLSAHAVGTAPTSLADAAARAALAADAAKVALPVGLKGAIQLMAWTKAQVITAVAAGAILIGGTTATVMYVSQPSTNRVVLSPGTPPPSIQGPGGPRSASAPPLAPDAKRRFDQAYALQPGQALKLVAPPFMPERAEYLQSIDNMHMFDVRTTKELFAFSWDGHEAGFQRWSGATPRLGVLIHDLIGLPSYKLEMRPEDFNRVVAGDWVFRQGATLEQKLADLSRMLADQQHVYLHFEQREGVRPVLVATGGFKYTPLDPQSPLAKDHMVHFYLGKPPRQPNGMAIGNRNNLLQAIGESLNREVFYESPEGGPATLPAAREGRENSFTWSNHLTGRLSEEQVLQAAANIGRQLDLTFTPDRRKVSYWSATPGADATASN